MFEPWDESEYIVSPLFSTCKYNRIGINVIVSRIKGKTANVLNREFPELQKKLPALWTRSKFIATVGAVSLDVVKQYIETQKGK